MRAVSGVIRGAVTSLEQRLTARIDGVEALARSIPAGTQGPKGDMGPAGRDGIDGKPGIDGKDGLDGADGKPGERGADGKDGASGRDGKDGIDGRDGRDAIVSENSNRDLEILIAAFCSGLDDAENS
jgi:hypothetical protein